MISLRSRIVVIATVVAGVALLAACGGTSPTAAPTTSEEEYGPKVVPLIFEASNVITRASQKTADADSLGEVLTLDLSEERAELRRIIADLEEIQPPPAWEGAHQEAIGALELMEQAFGLVEEGARELDVDKLELAKDTMLQALTRIERAVDKLPR